MTSAPHSMSQSFSIAWVRHLLPAVELTVISVLVVGAVTGPQGPWRALGVMGLLFGGAAYVHARSVDHKQQMCTRCARAAPLNPGEQVDRHAWWLRFDHHEISHGVVALLVGVTVLGGSSVFGAGVGLAALTLATMNYLAAVRHRRLSAWCAWCHADGNDWTMRGSSDGAEHPGTPGR